MAIYNESYTRGASITCDKWEELLHGEELWHKIPRIINLTVCKLLYKTYLPQRLPDIIMGRQKEKRNLVKLPYLPHWWSSHGGHHLRHHTVWNWWHIWWSLTHRVHSHGRIMWHAWVSHLKGSNEWEKSARDQQPKAPTKALITKQRSMLNWKWFGQF